jgi:effector-binding domain-containing protein
MATFTVETLEPQAAAVFRAEVPMEDLPAAFERGFHASFAAAEDQGVAVVGPPFGFYPRMPADTVEVLVGFPVAGAITPTDEVTDFELPGGPAVVGVHVGSYDGLSTTYDELAAWAAAEGITLADQMWESYVSDPEEQPDPATWETRIVWPLA